MGSGVSIISAVTEIGGETDLEKGLQKAIDAKIQWVVLLNAGSMDYLLA